MLDTFAETITNEEIAQLPLCHFGGERIIIDREEDIEAACEYLSRFPAIGFDTETRPSFKAGKLNKVALLQLSSPDKCFLFRLCRMKLDKPLIKLLEDESVKKIGADVQGDLRALAVLRHFSAEGFIDLQSIVHQWGIQEKSVRKMCAIITGKRVSKAQRLSNWEAAELTPSQIAYASTDAWVCLDMYERLKTIPVKYGKQIVRKTKNKN